MTNHASESLELQRLLGTALPPVGIAFLDAAPEGVPHVSSPAPASCSYWKRAADGASFWTDAADQTGCPVGAHTHGVPLAPDKAAELNAMIGTMVQLQYLKMDEVPSIPTRKGKFGVAVYAPLAALPVPADVVLVRGTARQLMLVAEAAQACGAYAATPAMGRPTCAALPLAEESGQVVASLGCIGNRVYTGLGDDEAYMAIAGAALAKLVAQLATVVAANRELEKFHRARAGLA